MLDPSLAFQTAVRSALIAAPEVLALVPADHIRAGSTRPDKLPSVILSGAQVQFLGHGNRADLLTARVFLDLHIWAVEDGADTARAIGAAVLHVLKDTPSAAAQGCDLTGYQKPSLIWMRDPQPDRAYTHGVMSLEAVITWAV